jgi:hypothetical protein
MYIDYKTLYKDVLTTGKIKQHSKILDITFDNNCDHITYNLPSILKLNAEIDCDIHHSDKTFLINEYDFLIFNNILSRYDDNEIYNIINNYKIYLKESGLIIFIDNLIEYNNQYYHPISIIKNWLFGISHYFTRIVSIRDVYDLLYGLELKVVDCYRLDSAEIISYPVQYFMITARIK